MKLILIIVIVVIVAASFFADYKWRRWIASRRHNQNDTNPTPRT